mgnify:CR=1 FL=1
MNTKNEIKISNKELKNLLLLKIIIEENTAFLNFLIEKEVIKRHTEIINFKERVASLKDLIEKSLENKYVDSLSIEINEVTERELREEKEEIKKIKNRNISKKYRETLKDNLKIFFDILKNINIEDISLIHNVKIYPIPEMERVYKYI